MHGSLHDTEDALQDTLLRAWRGLERFNASRPLRPCLDQLAKRPRTRAPARALAGLCARGRTWKAVATLPLLAFCKWSSET